MDSYDKSPLSQVTLRLCWLIYYETKDPKFRRIKSRYSPDIDVRFSKLWVTLSAIRIGSGLCTPGLFSTNTDSCLII